MSMQGWNAATEQKSSPFGGFEYFHDACNHELLRAEGGASDGV